MAHYTFSTRDDFLSNQALDVEDLPRTLQSVGELLEPLFLSCVQVYQETEGKEIDLVVERRNSYGGAGNSKDSYPYAHHHAYIDWYIFPKRLDPFSLAEWTISLSCWVFYQWSQEKTTCSLAISIGYTADPSWKTEQSRLVHVMPNHTIEVPKHLSLVEASEALKSTGDDYYTLAAVKFLKHLCEIDAHSKRLKEKLPEIEVGRLVPLELIERVQANPKLLKVVVNKLCGTDIS